MPSINRAVRAMIIAILMTTAVFAVLVAVPMNASAGTIHAPIEISSDANFADAGNPLSYGVTGGSGTESDPYIISGWNISSSTTTGIYIQYASVYFTIENCNITGDSSQNAIVLNSNSHGKVLNCSLTGNSYGVYSYDSRTEVLNCTISGGNTGIYSYNDVSIVSRGNNLSNFVNYAIYSDYSKAVSFVDNDISSGYVGIYISRAPGQITAMLGNDISDCPQSAIIVTQSRNARVFGNNITDCGYYAIQLEDCLDSMVFHNDINSSGYAEDYGGSGNQWDNGYPSGGNYWVQAPHIDVFSGADQLTPAPLGDGISDTPVTFWDSAADKYPLNASFSGNVEPVAGFNLTKRVLNTTTSLYMNASLSVDVEDPLSALQFRWDFEGDLAWDTAFSPTMDASHTYAAEGNYTVRLEVQDSGGLTGIATQDIVVSNNAHDTIYIYSDSDFTNPNSTTGVTWGSGTEADPYIISGWVIDATEDAGIYIEYTTAYFIIRDCRVYFGGFEYSGIYLYQAQNGKIETCIAGMNNFGIEMYYGENVEITGCNVTDNFQRGIYCYGSNDTLIRGNNASLNGYSGIHMYYSDNSLISNNTVNNRSDYGIYVYECFNLTILRNNLSGHLQYGVFAQWSERLNIVRNEFIGNPTGVYDVYTDGVNIIGNNFTGEFYDGSYYGGGVYLEVDNGASVHHNNFINLNMYAYDPGISTWDAGYPLGGNYWDIFTYPGDVNSGPAQNIPGADGIVDMPLGIDADSWDHYPLIAPFNMSNLPPIPAIATSAGIVNTSTVLYVDGIGSFDVEDPASALRVRWDWESDGTWDTSWSTTKTASHTYSIEGIYTITMEVNDTGGSVTSTTAMVVVDDMYRVTNIHIKGDTQFNVTNGVNGGGDGSAGNPYVIQNYVLDATNSRGIWIEHTDAYFVIQNVHVFYGEINSIEGIRLDDVQNGSIVLSSFMDNHYGIELQSSGNVSVSDCVFESCYMSIYGYQSDYLDFARLTSANTTDNSLYFGSYCDFITISDCDISHARQSGISFGGNSHDVQIMNASLDSTYYGIYCYEVSRLGITDCNVTSSYYAIMAYFSDNCTISNNEVFSSRYGMYLYDIENTLIDYNYLNATVQYGIFIYSTSRNIMVDNCHLNGNGNGIRIYSSGEYITISNCTAKNVNYGVYANSVTNISVRLNNFTGAGTYGVEVVQSSYFEIIGNNLSGTVYGAYVSNSNAFNILENSMWNNSNYGVFLSGCLDGRVKNNVVAGALSYGIYMSSCTAMMVAGNNLIENVNQAYDDNGPQNHWNETAAYGGGNYWSNYTFPDANADGFGDTPALIDLVDSADYLPLMSPWVPKQDVEAPVTTIALSGTIGTNGWYTSDVILNLTATDDFSGVKWTKYMIGTGAWVTYTANVTMLTDGSYVLTYCSEDKSGNDEDNKTVTVKIDKTLPTLTINQTSGMTVSKNYSVISWLGSDATSGIDHFEIKIDGGSFASVGLAMSHNFTLLTDGTHNVTVKAVDKAGHEYNTSIQFTVIAETAGGGTSGDLLTYGLIIVIIIVVVVALLMVMRRGKKPSPKLDEMKSEPPTPPAD